ncbi:MAG: class I SAM-dependent methyltransferase, partial [Gammaproteobacteria bacterium]|nr:class I SAM-dependent methyltransferase [Gammaproteobacteria bacterium]
MKPAKSQFASLVVAVSILFGTLAAAQMGAPTAKSETALAIEKALASPIRTAEERARDNLERKPVQTLEFFGLQPNMTVVEIMPGAGWYTKVLGQVLADKGTLHVSIGASRLAPRLKEWGLDKVKVSDGKFVTKPSGQRGVFDAESIEIPVQNADLVLTFRNLHNMTPGARALVNKAVFDTLKPGGVYGVVDHTRRHNEPTSPENWRRIDPVVVIKEALDAGFVL